MVVWVEEAGWWCLSAFLTRSLTPPFSAATTPTAYWIISPVPKTTTIPQIKPPPQEGDSLVPGLCSAHLLGNLALVLAAVDVAEVQRVAAELDTVGALDQSGAVALGDCPGEVVRDCGGHCDVLGLSMSIRRYGSLLAGVGIVRISTLVRGDGTTVLPGLVCQPLWRSAAQRRRDDRDVVSL